MADITAIILTKNEELNIEKCIKSIQSVVKRMIVVDSGSTDQTIEIAKRLGAEILINEMKPFYYAKQFAYALEKGDIATKWVLRIDADEELTEESAKELEALCNENETTDINGIVLRFEVHFMGRAIRHGGVYPFRKLCAFKYGKAAIEDKYMDEHIILFEGESIEMKADSLHINNKGLSDFIEKHNDYSTREMMDYFQRKANENGASKSEQSQLDRKAGFRHFIKWNIYYKIPAGLRSWCYYMYRYYLRAGFLDGKPGKIFCFIQAYWYRYLVDAKIYEEKNRCKKY